MIQGTGYPYCIKLRHGGYVILSQDNRLMETPRKREAETFNSIEDAEKIIREYWIDADIFPWEYGGNEVCQDI